MLISSWYENYIGNIFILSLPCINKNKNPSSFLQGQIKLVKPLDREILSQLTQDGSSSVLLTILVRDHGIPSLSSSTNVLVYVDDTNDNAPIFERDEYELTLLEMTPAGTPVLTVLAKDTDLPSNTKLQYSLLDSAEG